MTGEHRAVTLQETGASAEVVSLAGRKLRASGDAAEAANKPAAEPNAGASSDEDSASR
jgi:hypothetical protein